jgi:pyruvate formate lyase activating enzyme
VKDLLEIKGFERVSLIDYPGKMASIIFLPDCNFRCPFCQNPDLIERPGKVPTVSEGVVLDYLKGKKVWIDGVVVTGGEPTLHKGVAEFLKKVKGIGLLVKLDTNGTNPEMLEELVKEKLLDYIAMDIKAPPDRYGEVSRVRVNIEDIRRSVGIIRESGLDYEFRTTVPKSVIKKKDIEKIGEWLKGSRAFYIQQFRPDITLDKSFKKEEQYTGEELEGLAEAVRPFFEKVGIRE